jgi:hypothetical protein
MHRFIILDDDIYTLDTAEERDHAAEHMRDAGVDSLQVYAGGPDKSELDGTEFRSGSGSFSLHSPAVDECLARMTRAYGGGL